MAVWDPNAADATLVAAVLGSTAITAIIGTAGMYRRQAPQGAFPPYIVYTNVAGGEENSTPRDAQDLHYMIKAIAGDLSTAKRIDGHVRTALHNNPGTLSLTGWSCWWLARGLQYEFRDPVGGSPVYHAGSNYRIRWSADTTP